MTLGATRGTPIEATAAVAGGSDAVPPILSLRGVGMRFGRRDVLRNVDLDLPAAAAAAILGGNGAGKTTLLRLFAGALQPTAGRLGWPGSRRPRVALVAQTVALYPFLTVRENCIAAGRMEGLRGAALRQRSEGAIGQALAEAARDRPVGQLSGGMQRRAAIAAALMGDAALVILDEPTTGLDAEARVSIVATCHSLRAAGRAVVVATHDFALADAVADLGVFMREGTVAAAGAPPALCRTLFGDGRRVELVPAAAPDRRPLALLRSLGAEAAGESYVLFSPLDGNGLPTVFAELRGSGLRFREVRIAEPGTAELFRRHCAAAEASGAGCDAP